MVVAAQVILALRMFVSRETSPLDPVGITVGTIRSSTKASINPDGVSRAGRLDRHAGRRWRRDSAGESLLAR